MSGTSEESELKYGGEVKRKYPAVGFSYEYSLGYQKFDPLKGLVKPANFTDPKWPRFVDLFKGKHDENVAYRTLLLSKYAFYCTTAGTLYDVCVGTQPRDVTAMLQRVVYWGVPFFGGSLAYMVTLVTIGSIRKKNDQFTQIPAGYAAGAVLGAARKNLQVGFWTGTFLAGLGFFYKDSVLNGYEMFPDPRQAKLGLATHHKTRMTTRKHFEGDWVRTEAERACKRTQLEDIEIHGRDYTCG